MILDMQFSESKQHFTTDFHGLQTIHGKDGEDGKSAYEIALDNGFEGTEAEWLDSLHGKDGVDGQDGKDGVDGKDGQDGYTPVKGKDYFDGKDGKDGYTPQKNVDYFDGKDGQTGAAGKDGEDGVSPIITSEAIAGGHKLTITDASGTKTVDVMDGETGATGDDGVSCTHSWNGTTLTITSASGSSSADLKGEKGQDGNVSFDELTDAQKAELVTEATEILAKEVEDKSLGNTKLSPSCVFANNVFAEMSSYETFTPDTLKNFTVIEKFGVVAGNSYATLRTILGLYKDAKNYLKLYISGYNVHLDNCVGGTITQKTYIELVRSLTNVSDMCSKLDLVRKKLEVQGLVSGAVTTFIDEDISSFDLSALDTFQILTGAGKYTGHVFDVYARINDYFDYTGLMKQYLCAGDYNALPVVDGDKTVYEPTSISLGGTISETISATHKVSKATIASVNYFAMQSANSSISSKNDVSPVTRFKVSEMSDDTAFTAGVGISRANIVDENGVCLWNAGSTGGGSFVPEVNKWYYLITVPSQGLGYDVLYGMRAVGTFTIEVEGLFIGAPRSINMCAETWNGQYFTGAVPFKGTGVNFIAVNNFSGSGKFVPMLATNIDAAGNILMYNGSKWVTIG